MTLSLVLVILGILIAVLSFAGVFGEGNAVIGGVVGLVLFLIGIIVPRRRRAEPSEGQAETPAEAAPELEAPTAPVPPRAPSEPDAGTAEIPPVVSEPPAPEAPPAETPPAEPPAPEAPPAETPPGGRYVRVASTDEIAPGTCKGVEVEGTKICVVNLEGTYYAIDDTCTHMQASLSEGEIEDDEIICPWHGAIFDIKTGEVKGPPAMENVKKYNVRVSGSDIEVEI